ncbi:MAG: nucleoside-diphosphate sugar epimerase/dehydratase [Acidimicrobiia bacterium]
MGGAISGETLATRLRRAISGAAARVRADIAFAFIDIFIVIAAYSIAMAIRMLDPGIADPRSYFSDLAKLMPLIIVTHIVANVIAGAYGHVWEHASTDEAMKVVVANAAAGTLVLVVSYYLEFSHIDLVLPVGVVVMGALFSLAGMGLVRFRSRLFSFRKTGGGNRILVVGTGRDAAVFARQVPELADHGMVVGFVSGGHSAPEAARRLAGLPILGHLGQVADLVLEYDIDEVVVVGTDPIRTREVVDRCLEVDVRLRILPAAGDVMEDRSAAVDVRDIKVEDLLARPRVATDLEEVALLLKGKRVMVTGAGGSIGAEVVAQVLGFEPAGVWALDRDETLLHDSALGWTGEPHILLADVRDAEKTLRTFEKIRPDVVFHAAALKHVPVLEEFPDEAVLTNVIGTRNVIEAGSRAGMSHFVLISTDKAVDPSSVMGATKRIAELMVQLGQHRNDGCVYTAVRFGNVLGSRGSVIPTFVEQIKIGGPVTVTDADMTRYFMTVDEAVQLVLQASALAVGSEVFVLDMGDPVRIVDLARRLIRLAGLTPGADIQIEYTGRRPGEKLTESLSTDPMALTRNPQIFEARLGHPTAYVVLDSVADLEDAAHAGNQEEVRRLLSYLASAAIGVATGANASEFEPQWS